MYDHTSAAESRCESGARPFPSSARWSRTFECTASDLKKKKNEICNNETHP